MKRYSDRNNLDAETQTRMRAFGGFVVAVIAFGVLYLIPELSPVPGTDPMAMLAQSRAIIQSFANFALALVGMVGLVVCAWSLLKLAILIGKSPSE